jgi:hypothetical protein
MVEQAVLVNHDAGCDATVIRIGVPSLDCARSGGVEEFAVADRTYRGDVSGDSLSIGTNNGG